MSAVTWNFKLLSHHMLDGFGGMGEGMSIQIAPDGRRILWLARRSARELYPFAALLHGLRAELAISPEGLDSFLTQAITVGMKGLTVKAPHGCMLWPKNHSQPA